MQPIPASYDALVREVKDLRRTVERLDAERQDMAHLIVSLTKRIQQLETNEMRKAAPSVVDVRPIRPSLMREGEHPGRSLGIGTHERGT